MKKFEGMLILSDMDGTILSDSKQISEENIAAIEYFKANGGRFSLATGRSKTTMERYISQVPVNAPVVVYNGAGVYDFAADKFVFTEYMPDDCVEFLNDLCGTFPRVACEIYLDDCQYVIQPNELSEHHFKQLKLPQIVKEPHEVPLPWVKFNFVIPGDLIDEVEKYAIDKYGKKWFYQRSGDHFFEVMAPGIDKGTGALAVCEALGIDRKYLFTIGDHMNDIELIEAGAISFCPGNAVPYIREIANVIVKDNNNSAVADMINWLDKKF